MQGTRFVRVPVFYKNFPRNCALLTWSNLNPVNKEVRNSRASEHGASCQGNIRILLFCEICLEGETSHRMQVTRSAASSRQDLESDWSSSRRQKNTTEGPLGAEDVPELWDFCSHRSKPT
ncbi:hypothetical protein TGMAS_249535 [Toxoplasma gondii MAS]|uniref:Uncharacterized protein n=1 Tax=Toxoplasma gondii MAS TaxID=943118 RepID=A0A086QDV0_TOXGO|nr:hypothetical protein TGMAS_249535 [Toxoplasma gondii MAS]